MMRAFVFALTLVFSLAAHAVIEVRSFDDPAKQKIYEELTHELRCLVCQNQNIAASNADLAKDLRDETYEMIEAGADKQAVKQYMVDRYGDFVLYRPPVQTNTLLLWTGPAILLVIAVIIVFVVARRRAVAAELDESERRQARRLLGE